MKAIIQKLELKKILNRHYLNIELVDENGIKHSINNPFLSDDVNFRKQVFGILSACNNFDLMRLATNNPEKKKMIGYYQNWLKILENENGEWLNIDKDSGLYICKSPKRKTHDMFNKLRECGMIDVDVEEGVIEGIISRSGTFQLIFTCRNGTTFYTTGQIYGGFGYPLSIGREFSKKDTAISAKMFTSFIVSLLHLYGINDLLDFGGIKDSLPEVEIELSDNKVISITSPETGMGLSITSTYNIINIFEEKVKVKAKTYKSKQ